MNGWMWEKVSSISLENEKLYKYNDCLVTMVMCSISNVIQTL